MEMKTSPSLRPGAPEFIPSTPLPPLSTGADSFSVHQSWRYTAASPLQWSFFMGDVLDSVQDASSPNHWSEEEKATPIAMSLTGAALTVLSNLLEERHSNYRALISVLENRFGMAHQTELHRMKLRSRTRRREETSPELMEDIEQLVRMAYPNTAPEMLELLAKDQFIDSLFDEDIKLKVAEPFRDFAACTGGCTGARVLSVGTQTACEACLSCAAGPGE